MKHLSVVGKGYHSEEKVVGFYNIGDRIKFWGTRGAFWGGFWGAHGTAEEMARAKTILGTVNPSRIDAHAGAESP
jgi:hypothetical protein